jgi:hypothetical protein
MMKQGTLFLLIILFGLKASAQQAYRFNGTSNYVTFGNASALGLNTFTLEVWFRKEGSGITTTSGVSGLTAVVPIVAKGRGENDGGTMDCNYLLGIQNGVLAADFEAGAGQLWPGQNHPVFGKTIIQDSIWYHAAATYDGLNWRLYLNGTLEAELGVGRMPQGLSVQHASIATGLSTTGAPLGYFKGMVDEVRIWNYARSRQSICDSANLQFGTAPGLVGRWSLDDTSGTTVAGNGSSGISGTAVNAPVRVALGAPFNLICIEPNRAPNQPGGFMPADSSVYAANLLRLSVADPDTDRVKVYFMGREHDPASDSPKFTIIPIPDVQYYTSHQFGGTNEIFKNQMQWIVDSISAKNIAYAVELGDCTDHGDNNGIDIEWKRADTAFQIIENPATTRLKDGLPYGVCVGNHDQWPNGSATGTTIFYNQFFGEARFKGRAYYGGHYGTNNDNHFQLFSAGGLDFIAINLEYDTSPDVPVLNWADSLLKAFPKRRGILSSHYLIGSGGAWGTQGLATYNALKNNPNLDLMLCGHINPYGEARRSDTWNGHTVHTMLSDYQDRVDGGTGWIRIMEFNPAMNQIAVKTYSTTLDKFETDEDSEFILPYEMTKPWDTLGVAFNVPSGASASVTWNSLQQGKRYDWYTVVADPYLGTTVSAINTFTYDPTATGVRGLQAGQQLQLFPNPNTGRRIVLSYPKEVPAALQVSGVDGKAVYNGTVTLGNNVVLPLQLEPGVYVITVTVEGQRIAQKLVVQ